MVCLNSIQNPNRNYASFGKKNEQKNEDKDALLIEQSKKHPITLPVKIQANKVKNAFTVYPKKGFEGSKNANFYQFLTMGIVPYLTGSAMMISVFNLASKFFPTEAAVKSLRAGKKMGLGVVLYGVGKTLSKKLIETPVKLKYGIDVNMPYKKKIDLLPEKDNLDNLKSYEYHKVFESVDFPRYDLLYDVKEFGEDRNAYYNKVGKKLKLSDEDLKYADQKVKPLLKEKVVKTKLFSTMASYLWAAVGVGIAMQKPWENFVINPKQRLANYNNYKQISKAAKAAEKNIAPYENVFKDFGKRFVTSCKDFVNKGPKATKIAGRALLGLAIGVTLLGNFKTLFDFNKNRGNKVSASSPLIDESKEKVVC